MHLSVSREMLANNATLFVLFVPHICSKQYVIWQVGCSNHVYYTCVVKVVQFGYGIRIVIPVNPTAEALCAQAVHWVYSVHFRLGLCLFGFCHSAGFDPRYGCRSAVKRKQGDN